MTTNPPPDRLDRIEDDLETVKDILLTVARRQERLSEAQDRTQIQLDRLGDRVDQVTVNLEYLGQRVDRVTEQMGGLAIQMEEMAQRAEQDRSQATIDRADFRSTFQQLLEVLNQRFTSNGH